MKRTFPLTALATLATVAALHADVFYPIVSVESDPDTNDFYPAVNLIQGPGVGFDDDPGGFHDGLDAGATGSWVTDAPLGGVPADYIEGVGTPVLTFDLGSDTLLDEISVWGYSSGNSNGCSEFSLRFATDAEGKTGFGNSIAYNPSFIREFPGEIIRDSFEFAEQVTARYVELTCLDNFWNEGQSPPGGDRVGLAEVAFRVATESGGPNILVPGSLRLLNNGTAQTVEITVFNNGDAPLEISSITVAGDDQASFTPGAAPGTIAPNGSALVTVDFDPAGITGDSTVTVNFASNDPDEPTKSLELTLAFPSFYTIQDVLSTSDVDFNFNPDLWPSSNLIQGPGVGFDANPPHNKTSTNADGNWVTADDAGFPSDYIEQVTQPVIRLDLGEDSLLTEISVWGYSNGNANGVKDFSLRFATAADGELGFGSSITYNPVFNELPFDDTSRLSFPFDQPVTARYVEFTCLDNFWNPGASPPGGDRVGLGEISFEIPVVSDDATLEAPLTLALDLDGTVQTFTLNVRNSGTPDLEVSGLSFSGPDAAAFSQVAVPGPITTFTSGEVSFSFNPAGLAGPVSATLQIASNDPNNSPSEVQLAGVLHDPQIAAVAPDPFLFPAGSGAQDLSVLIGNIGATQTLNISDISVSGPSAANFTVTNPPASIAASGSANLTVRFDPLGGDGTFAVSLDITTDDPVTPVISVPVSARIEISDPLVAFWPLDDAPDTIDVTEATGNHPGTSVNDFLVFGEPGARPYSGTAADFDIDTSITVPFSPELNPTSFTVVAWVFPRSAAQPHQSVITSRADGFPDLGGYVLYNAPSGNWEYWSGAGIGANGWNSVNGGAVVVDEWVHLALTYDETTQAKTVYVNGTETGTTTINIQPNGSLPELPQSDLHIGSGADDGSQFFFSGRIDEVAVFRTALSAPEIQNIIDNGVAATYLDPAPPAGASFAITSFSFDPVTKQIDLTFDNAPAGGATLVLRRSTDLVNWIAVDDNVTGSPLSFTDSTLPAGATKVYYRLDNLPE